MKQMKSDHRDQSERKAFMKKNTMTNGMNKKMKKANLIKKYRSLAVAAALAATMACQPVIMTAYAAPADGAVDTQVAAEAEEGKIPVVFNYKDGSESVSGVKLEIVDADDKVVESFKTDGKEHKLSLKPGKYTLREVSGPDGYSQSKDIKFKLEVNEVGIPVITIGDKQSEKLVVNMTGEKEAEEEAPAEEKEAEEEAPVEEEAEKEEPAVAEEDEEEAPVEDEDSEEEAPVED